MIYNYIIIGAGISGIYFSFLLKEKDSNIKVLILESSNRIGGRIYKENTTQAQMGSKFIHAEFERFLEKKNFEYYQLGNLSGKNDKIKTSMLLEEIGSLSKTNHSLIFNYENEKNAPFDFTSYLNKLKRGLNIKLETPFRNYVKKDNYYLINNKYKSEKIIFATSPNVLKYIQNPYKKLFKHYTQSKIITLAFCLDKSITKNIDIKSGFSFYEDFLRTSFYYDYKTNILYVNLFDRPKNFSIKNIEKRISDKFNLKKYTLIKQDWNKDTNLLGAWSIPKSSLTSKIIKTLENGYNNSIYYLGDYLGDMSFMSQIPCCMKNAESLIKRINNLTL